MATNNHFFRDLVLTLTSRAQASIKYLGKNKGLGEGQ